MSELGALRPKRHSLRFAAVIAGVMFASTLLRCSDDDAHQLDLFESPEPAPTIPTVDDDLGACSAAPT